MDALDKLIGPATEAIERCNTDIPYPYRCKLEIVEDFYTNQNPDWAVIAVLIIAGVMVVSFIWKKVVDYKAG